MCAKTILAAILAFLPLAAQAQIDRQIVVTRLGQGTGTVTSDPAGIACGAVCFATFAQGTVVTLTAVPGAGKTFQEWTGPKCMASNNPVCSFTLTSDFNFTARFGNATAPTFFSAAATTFTVGVSGLFAPAANGDPIPVMSLQSGALPSGVTFAGGVLSGPAAPGKSGVYPLVFRATNSGGFVDQPFTLTVSLPALDPLADQDGDGIPNGIEDPEGRNALAKDNDIFTVPRLFAMQQYRDFLGREGDAGGIQFYMNLLNTNAATREQIIGSFLASPEFTNGLPPVIRLYLAFFNRIPDYPGLVFQVGAFRAGTPLASLAQNFYNAPEFTNTYGALTNTQYINLVYQNVLGRAPDTGGFNFYKNLLDSGTLTKGQMMIGFSESPEFQQLSDNEAWAVSVYVGLLRRTPEPSGLAFYTNLLDTGTPRSAIIPGFFNSPEYHQRFLP